MQLSAELLPAADESSPRDAWVGGWRGEGETHGEEFPILSAADYASRGAHDKESAILSDGPWRVRSRSLLI